jgi:hypothetical protein
VPANTPPTAEHRQQDAHLNPEILQAIHVDGPRARDTHRGPSCQENLLD